MDERSMIDDEDERRRLQLGGNSFTPVPVSEPRLAARQKPQQAAEGGGQFARAAALLRGDTLKAPMGERSKFQAPDRGGADAVWGNVEMKAPEESPWGAILGLADLILNKGRNTAGIIENDAKARQRRMETWQKFNGPDAVMARLREQQALERGDAAELRANNDQFRQMKVLQLQQQQAKLQNEHWDANFRRQTGLDNRAESHFQTQEDRAERTLQQQAEQQRQQRAMHYAQMAQQRDLAEQQRAFMLTQQAENNAAAERRLSQQLGQQDTNSQRQLEAARVRAGAANAQRGVGVGIPGLTPLEGQEQQLSTLLANPTTRLKISKEVGDARNIDYMMGRLGELYQQPSSAANQREYNGIIKDLIGDRSKEGSTGVLSGTEYERYVADLPEYGSRHDPVNKLRQMSGGWRATADVLAGKDPMLETFGQLRSRFRESQNQRFGAYGAQLGPMEARSPAPQLEQQTPYQFGGGDEPSQSADPSAYGFELDDEENQGGW